MKIAEGKKSEFHLLVKSNSPALDAFTAGKMELFRGDSMDDTIEALDRILAPHGLQALVHSSELSDFVYVEAVPNV